MEAFREAYMDYLHDRTPEGYGKIQKAAREVNPYDSPKIKDRLIDVVSECLEDFKLGF